MEKGGFVWEEAFGLAFDEISYSSWTGVYSYSFTNILNNISQYSINILKSRKNKILNINNITNLLSSINNTIKYSFIYKLLTKKILYFHLIEGYFICDYDLK